jgi:hypothetical protein
MDGKEKYGENFLIYEKILNKNNLEKRLKAIAIKKQSKNREGT